MGDKRLSVFRVTVVRNILITHIIIIFLLALLFYYIDEENVNRSIAILPMMLLYIILEWIHSKVEKKFRLTFVSIKTIIIIVMGFFMSFGTWVLIVGLGPILLIYTLSVTRRKKMVIVVFFLIAAMTIAFYFYYYNDIKVNLRIIMAFLLVIIAAIVFKVITDTYKKNLDAYMLDLGETHNEIISSAHILEKEKIARDFHDTFAQGIVGIIMYLDVLKTYIENKDQNKIREILDTLNPQAKKLLSDAMNVSDKIDDITDKNNNILNAVSTEILTIRKKSNLNIVENVDESAVNEIPLFAVDNLSYMIIEALRNAVNHSSCTNITLSINKYQDKIIVVIKDDGKGFIVEEKIGKNRRYGFIGMKERAKEINADLVIDSVIGEGTEVSITIPIFKVREV